MKREAPILPAVLAAGLTIVLLLGFLVHAYYQSTLTPLTSLPPLTNRELAEKLAADEDRAHVVIWDAHVSCTTWTEYKHTRLCHAAFKEWNLCFGPVLPSTDDMVVSIHGHAYHVDRRQYQRGECPL
jgi:hypothetical protein